MVVLFYFILFYMVVLWWNVFHCLKTTTLQRSGNVGCKWLQNNSLKIAIIERSRPSSYFLVI